MVNFDRNFQRGQIEEYKQNYFDYKKLKLFMKKSLNSLINSKQSRIREREKDLLPIDKLESPKSSIDSQFLKEETINKEEKLNVGGISAEMESITIEDVLNEFFKGLDKEIKKIYLFFVNKERDLYVQINSHLHIRQQYETFNLLHISKEFEELNKLSLVTYNLSKFINDNMLAIQNILRKFDKKFQNFCGKISLPYIKQKLDMKNSDLLYILQFKIIDEVSTLLEDLMKDLKSKYETKRKSLIIQTEPMRQGLIHNAMSEDFIISDKDLTKLTESFMSEMKLNLFNIDKHYQNFKTNFKEWNLFLKSRAVTNLNSITQETSLCGVSLNFNRSSSYEHINVQRKTLDLDESTAIFSKENKRNIYFTLIHSFFFMFCYSIVLATNKNFVAALGHKPHFSGIIMSLTPLGALISLLFTNRLTRVSYKFPMILSMASIVIGNFLYIIAGSFSSIILMALGRFLLGFGSNRVANRSYLLRFIPKSRLTQYLTYFQLSSITGLAAGLIFSVPILYVNDLEVVTNSTFNAFTNSSWFTLVISIILCLLIIFLYTEPLQSSFNVYAENVVVTETASTYSTIKAETLSKQEENMIEEINDKLSEFNDKNKYSDTNLVSRSIEQIIWCEKKTCGYIYKCLIAFMCILFVVRLTTESLLIISPYYIQDLDSNLDSKLIACLMGFSVLFVIPLWYLYSHYLGRRLGDRRLMLILIIACIVFNVLILNLFYTSITQYCIMFVFLIISATLLENISTTLFAKIIPSDYKLLNLNVGMVIQITTTAGRFFGALMLTLAGFASDENLNRITYGITLGIFVTVLTVIIILYEDLRIKAIARIMRSRAFRKLKKAEF